MIYTGSYKNCKTQGYRTISISGDRGRSSSYRGNYFSVLAPKLKFWMT